MFPQIPSDASERPVLVIGAAGVDMVGVLAQPAEKGKSNLAHNRFSYGGVARNVAENLARLGQPVSLITAAGEDHLGREMLEYTRGCGVDISGSFQVQGYSTASYLAIYDSSGRLEMAVEDMDVLRAITPAILKANAHRFEEASLVFVDANLSPVALKTVFSLAKKARIPVCADTTSPALAERLLPYLSSLFLLTANSAEASVLCGHNPEVTERSSALEAARCLVDRDTEIAIITLAQFGVCYATPEVSGHVPAVRTKIIDPTGAGDALTASVLFGLTNQIPLDECIRLGVTAASLVLKHKGTVFPGLSLERLYDELAL